MVRFLGEMQNTYDQLQKGRSNTDLMKGLRSTLAERFGVLYTTYRKALLSKFEASTDGEDVPGQYKEDGLVKTMAKYEADSGFSLPDNTKFPKGFVYIEEVETDGEVAQVSQVLGEEIYAHLDRVRAWCPILSHLGQGMMTHVKELAFSKHSVNDAEEINTYFMHWTVALFRE